MRKTNSKAHLQPSNTSNALLGASPNHSKQQSMIQQYKQKTQVVSGYSKQTGNATSIISKVISAKRNANINQNKDTSHLRIQSNSSAQAIKQARVLSPGDAILRKNDTLIVSRNNNWEKAKLYDGGRIPQPNQLQQNETINNMKKQLQKNRSLQSFFNTTQTLGSARRNQPSVLKTESNQRDITRRGSKFTPSTIAQGVNYEKLSMTNQVPQLIKPDQTLQRIRSAFLNFNQTQPSLLINKAEIDLRHQPYSLLKCKMIQQSPSVSSEEDQLVDQEYMKNTHKRIASAYQEGIISSKNSKKPNGSFIEQKMKNCLQSRNNETVATANYQTYQADAKEEKIKQNQTLTKNQSQPQLHRLVSMTQRTAQVKTSFLNRKDSTSQTPALDVAITPIIKQNQQSINSQTNKVNVLKGEMKSLNLSPIMPQNLVKNIQFCTANSQERTVDTIRKIDIRKDSVSSKNQSLNNNKSVLSSKKEGDLMGIKSLSNDVSTEKKMKAGFLNFNGNKNFKQGYCSQETERAPGAINSYSTAADEIQTVPMFEFNNDKEKNQTLRIKDKNYIILEKNQENSRNKLNEQRSQQNIFMNNQSIIKVTQILNNNNMNNNKRYNNFNSAQDQVNQPKDKIVSTQKHTQIQTPRAVPEFSSFVETTKNVANIKISLPNDDDKTLKKHQQQKSNGSDSSLDEEMPDDKDFDEFYWSNKKDQQSEALLKQQQEELIVKEFDLKHTNFLLKNYSDASQSLMHKTTKHPYDDRNSLVNYDTSLLTHNTGRDNQQSPFSFLRPSKPDEAKNITQDQMKIADNFFMINDQDKIKQHDDKQTKELKIEVYESAFDTQEQDEEPIQVEYYERLEVPSYQNFLSQIQKEEEEAIENITQRIVTSTLYKEMKDDKERAKYLSNQVLEVRKHYKQVFVEQILKQAKIQ